jgi:hypothetical protein
MPGSLPQIGATEYTDNTAALATDNTDNHRYWFLVRSSTRARTKTYPCFLFYPWLAGLSVLSVAPIDARASRAVICCEASENRQ